MRKRSEKIKIDDLREIGWAKWDPIGLSLDSDDWREGGFEDEYDGYLMQAVGQLLRGVPTKDVALYLQALEENSMGLGKSGNASLVRATDTASMLKQYLAKLT